MSSKVSKLPKPLQAAIRVVAAVLLNLGIVLSAVYILFHILDQYNPHKFIYSNLPWLPIAIPIVLILAVVLYDVLFFTGAFKKHAFQKKRMWLIILCDLILFSALSLTLYLRTCTNPLNETNEIEVYQLSTPPGLAERTTPPTVAPSADTSVPVSPDPSEDTILIVETPAPSDAPLATGSVDVQPSETPDGSPTEPPSPENTEKPTEAPATEEPILGLLGNKYAEKFADPPVEQAFAVSERSETLADGTVKSLVYTYSGRNAAVDVYHYQKGKLEYQLADIYVRSIDCFRAAYSLSYHDNVKTQKYATEINAILSTNGDNFNSGKIQDGLVIRNFSQLYPGGGSKPTKYSRDLCVLFYDGTMRVYDCVLDSINYDEIVAQYPWQAFYFGPKLLNDDGTAKQKFNSTLSKANPRTALGYYEPGHYALIVVLGTREMIDYHGKNHGNGKSPGMTLTELSALCEQLGFTAAYNLDGGGSSGMVYNSTVFGHNDRTHSDILAVTDQ